MCYTDTGQSNQHGFDVEWSSCSMGTFEWALQMMRKGKKVRRDAWSEKTCYIFLKHHDKTEDEIIFNGTNKLGAERWDTQGYQLLLEDWEIYTPKCGSCGQQTQ